MLYPPSPRVLRWTLRDCQGVNRVLGGILAGIEHEGAVVLNHDLQPLRRTTAELVPRHTPFDN